ncbi:MAG: response regulator [Prolixibacteraceae bacterium]|nr:response regulator [Prolixibacteraceae bacterium]
MEDNSKLRREQAKDELRKGKKIDTSLYEKDLKGLVEELSIYQIELEHQNQELYKSHEEIQQSKDRYLDLFDNAPISYLIVDSNGIIKDINQTACLLFESSKNKLVKKKITNIIHRDFQDVYYIYFRSLIKQKYNQTCDIKLQKANNTFFYARIQGIRQTSLATKEPEFRLAIIDITIQKEMELNLLIAKEKAQEHDKLKSAFLANMSHEIRTPMNGILGFAELLKEGHLTDKQQLDYINIIEKSGTRMLNIINDIVDISKIEAGLMKLDIKESNINEQIEYIYTFFKPEVEAKEMKLSFKNTLPAKEAIIKTDSEKVYAILTNLVKNAIKYTEKGSIEFGYEIVETQGRASLQFYVKDTGIGIPADRQSAIFERFVQADVSDRMARQGAGLGLAITKSYVEMLGGKIWVESQEGVGSTFHFTLPYNAEPVTETINQQLATSGKIDTIRNLKILIAEDDEISEKLVEIAVKILSREIVKVRTGVEAVLACIENPDIDLILMDIRMPEMGGFDATRQIREFNKEVVIIAQTAYGQSDEREKAIAAGCNDYIAKPIKKEELLALMQKYFKK